MQGRDDIEYKKAPTCLGTNCA